MYPQLKDVFAMQSPQKFDAYGKRVVAIKCMRVGVGITEICICALVSCASADNVTAPVVALL